MNELMLFEKNEKVVVSTRIVAERFEKRHQEVLYAIDGRECSCGGLGCNKCSQRGYQQIGFLKEIAAKSHLSFFTASIYIDSMNRRQREYLCTRDGFSLLAMGFTGQKALEWKLKYIEAFNCMEAALHERQSTEWLITRRQGKLMRRNETDALALLIGYAEAQGSKNMSKQAYTVYTKLVNSLVGIEVGHRDTIPFKTLSTIVFIEDMIQHTVLEEMEHGTYYKEIYKKCRANGEQIMRFAYLPTTA